MSDSKVCKRCGKTFYRRPDTPPAKFASRKYCSTKCSGRNTIISGRGTPRKTRPNYSKTCSYCGRTFCRRDNEDGPAFHRRQHCCTKCARGQSGEEYLPTREEIEEATAKIRASWTPEERAIRAGGDKPTPWTIPEARVIFG